MFEMASLMRRLAEVQEPLARRMNGALEIWYPAVPGRSYLVAVDPAGGGCDGDFSAMRGGGAGDGLQCAELQARLGTLETAEQAAALAREYNGALVVVERNNHGAGVLAYLHGVCRYGNVYEQDGQPGWLTSSLSRPHDDRAAGAGAGGAVRRCFQPQAAGGVPDVCAAEEWPGRGAGRIARRLRDGDCHGTGRPGRGFA